MNYESCYENDTNVYGICFSISSFLVCRCCYICARKIPIYYARSCFYTIIIYLFFLHFCDCFIIVVVICFVFDHHNYQVVCISFTFGIVNRQFSWPFNSIPLNGSVFIVSFSHFSLNIIFFLFRLFSLSVSRAINTFWGVCIILYGIRF